MCIKERLLSNQNIFPVKPPLLYNLGLMLSEFLSIAVFQFCSIGIAIVRKSQIIAREKT